jgi:2-polyprenyl-3-methyl-5-hydroxy-6-metoxy-1,4-benzoquinol methylase
VLERLYPNQEQITACGLGEATEFQAAFPRVRYRRVATGEPLPFANKSFDVATSNAVLEHVGSRENQARFIAEMVRVARRVFISVPHRFFPVEHHTAIPLAHWTDTTWFLACAVTGKQKWSQDKELILMSARHLSSLVPPGSAHQVGYTGLLLGPFSSNLFLAIT